MDFYFTQQVAISYYHYLFWYPDCSRFGQLEAYACPFSMFPSCFERLL